MEPLWDWLLPQGICCVRKSSATSGRSSDSLSYLTNAEWPSYGSGSEMYQHTVQPRDGTCFIRSKLKNWNHFFVHPVVCLKIQWEGVRMVLSIFLIFRFDLLTLELEVMSNNCVHDRWILSTNELCRYLDIFAGWPFLAARRQAGRCAVTEAERWTCCWGRILTEFC